MMSSWVKDGIIFQIIWLTALFSQSSWLVGTLLLLWFVLRPLASRLLIVTLVIGLVGITIDTLLVLSGWLSVISVVNNSELPSWMLLPPWLILLWLACGRFVLVMSTQVQLPLLGLCCLFLVGGLGSYAMGESRGLMLLAWGEPLFVLFFSLWWMLLPVISRYGCKYYGN